MIINQNEMEYMYLLHDVLAQGEDKSDRTGTGTISHFGTQMRFDLSKGFPLLTTKRVYWKGVVHELLWFLSGDTNIKYLQDNDVHIWDEWCQNVGDFPNKTRLTGWVKQKRVQSVTPYFGDFSTKGINVKKGSIEDKLRNVWTKMMKRCYDSTMHNYNNYGSKGVSVCRRWHECNNFIEDVKKLQNWDLKLENWNIYELDKDYFGSNVYSPDSCVWLHTAENNSYIGDAITIEFNGEQNTYVSYSHAEEETGIPSSTLHRWMQEGVPESPKGVNKKYKGAHVNKAVKDGYVFRRLFTNGDLGPVYGAQWVNWKTSKGETINQIQNVIDRIKTKPHCRRLVVTAWNPEFVPDDAYSPVDNVGMGKAALASCHALFQFEVTNGKLNCLMYQRSVDCFLGLPFNIASYALLTHMVAQQCNLDVGHFVWTGGDTHIYKNHLNQVNEQINRTPGHPPRLIINRRPEDIFSYKFEDFELANYKPQGAIKAPISI